MRLLTWMVLNERERERESEGESGENGGRGLAQVPLFPPLEASLGALSRHAGFQDGPSVLGHGLIFTFGPFQGGGSCLCISSLGGLVGRRTWPPRNRRHHIYNRALFSLFCAFHTFLAKNTFHGPAAAAAPPPPHTLHRTLSCFAHAPPPH